MSEYRNNDQPCGRCRWFGGGGVVKTANAELRECTFPILAPKSIIGYIDLDMVEAKSKLDCPCFEEKPE